MNIFRVLTKNLGRGPITVRFPREVPHPKDFRGPIRINEDKCICCGMCDYVCVSEAVIVDHLEENCEWAYYPGRCAFCGKCVQICPTQALSHESEKAPAYFHSEDLNEKYHIPYPVCSECGRIAQPVDEAVLTRAFQEVTDEMRAWLQMCPRCRQKRSVRDLSSAIKTASLPKSRSKDNK